MRLRSVKSQVRQHQQPPYYPTHQIKNYKKEAMMESKIRAFVIGFSREVHRDRKRE